LDLTVAATLGGQHIEVIRQLSFKLAPGRILGIVGESGAGKSMIGRAIAHALPAGFAVTGGTLRLDDEDLVQLTPERRRALLGRDIAFIPQEPMTALNPVMTIGAQFAEHLRRLRVVSRRNRALELLDAVHLRDGAALLRRYPHQLSGGMCQRVLIAMAFAGRPRVIVADEPTTALDVTIQARIVQLIAELQRNVGTAVMFITHDLRLASRICDEIIVLYAGRAMERGPAASLLADPAHPYTRSLQLASPPMTGPRRTLFALADRMPGLVELAGKCTAAASHHAVRSPKQTASRPNHRTALPDRHASQPVCTLSALHASPHPILHVHHNPPPVHRSCASMLWASTSDRSGNRAETGRCVMRTSRSVQRNSSAW
jgi:peptide/nickel transport system ATP-binding protein